jgi:hypothetical protein
MEESKVQKWEDGQDMVCANCGKPIYEGEEIARTVTSEPEKRDAIHAHVCFGKGENK